MKFYELSPEVAGEIGENSIVNYSVHPPIVKKLQYVLQGWLGDDLLESFPCYIVNERLKTLISDNKLTGCRFDKVDIQPSEQFIQLYPNRNLPEFAWIIVNGKPHSDDFGISEDYHLIVSGKALKVLKQAQVLYCEVTELPSQ